MYYIFLLEASIGSLSQEKSLVEGIAGAKRWKELRQGERLPSKGISPKKGEGGEGSLGGGKGGGEAIMAPPVEKL